LITQPERNDLISLPGENMSSTVNFREPVNGSWESNESTFSPL